MFRSPLLPLFLTVFVDVLGLTIVLPLLPFYGEHFGATPLMVGVLMATYPACQLFCGPLLGRASDRVGRKPTLVLSQCGTFIGFTVLGLANSLPILFLGRVIDGCTSGNLTIAQAYISDVTKPENRTKAFALIGIAFGGGFLIGPAISGAMAQRWGFSSPPFAAAALSFTSILCTAFLLPKVEQAKAAEGDKGGRSLAFGRYFQNPASRRRLLEFFAFTLSFSTLIGGLALFLERKLHFGVKDTGYVFAFSGLIGGLIQGGIGRLVKKLGEEKLALYGFATMAVGYGFLGLVTGVPMLLVLTAISAFGIAVTRPSITTMITKAVGRHEQGSVLGVSQSLSSISSMVGPLVAGALIGRGLLTTWGLTAGAFAIVGIVLSLQPQPPPLEASVGG